MRSFNLPDKEYLWKVLDYDPDTGLFTWKAKPLSAFKTPRASSTWNTRFAGKPAMTVRDGNGYLKGRIDYIAYAAHRLAWRMMTGDIPMQIDHINGVRDDNRLINLRSVSASENRKNMRISKYNRSGISGVTDHGDGRWSAKITINNQPIWLGLHKTKDEAIAARIAAERVSGFHPNHGRTA